MLQVDHSSRISVRVLEERYMLSEKWRDVREGAAARKSEGVSWVRGGSTWKLMTFPADKWKPNVSGTLPQSNFQAYDDYMASQRQSMCSSVSPPDVAHFEYPMADVSLLVR